MDIQVLKVSKNSNINAVAEKIIQCLLNDGILHVDCIGIKATYMTVKAFIQVTEYLINKGYRFNLRPYYIRVDVCDGEEFEV